MKIYLKYCTYASIILLIEASLIIFSNDQRITIGQWIKDTVFPNRSFQLFFMTVFMFCFVNQFLLAVTGLVVLLRRHPVWRGLFFVLAAVVFCFTVIKYIGDSW